MLLCLCRSWCFSKIIYWLIFSNLTKTLTSGEGRLKYSYIVKKPNTICFPKACILVGFCLINSKKTQVANRFPLKFTYVFLKNFKKSSNKTNKPQKKQTNKKQKRSRQNKTEELQVQH